MKTTGLIAVVCGIALGFLLGSWTQEFASVMAIEDVLASVPAPTLEDFNHTPAIMVLLRVGAAAVLAGGLLLALVGLRRSLRAL